jgi:geranylgeranyl pyrophosphate synthase
VQDDAHPTSDNIGAHIRKAIDSYCEDRVFRDAMLRVMARPGFALHPRAGCRAGIVALETYRAVSGPPGAAAIQAAAAVELHMQAAYLFDHVADHDESPNDGLTPAQELAVAIALLNCGQSVMHEAAFSAGLSGPALRSLLHWAADCARKCCTGQFLDAYLEKQPSATVDESLKMTSLKAGSLGRFAAGLGARMATVDPDVVEMCGDFGFNLFTYFQLLDDLRDASPEDGMRRDLAQHKKTLPVVFFCNSQAERNRGVGCSIIPQETRNVAAPDTAQDFDSAGTRVFGAVVAEVFLNRAKTRLTEIKSRLGTVGNLECVVRPFEISPQEVVPNS